MQRENYGSEKRTAQNNGGGKDGSVERSPRILGNVQSNGPTVGPNSISVGPQDSYRGAEFEHGRKRSGEVIAELIKANQQQIAYLEAQNTLLNELLNSSEQDE
jgi:hypothetical protein